MAKSKSKGYKRKQKAKQVESEIIYFLAFLSPVTRSPAAANGPRGLNFSMRKSPRPKHRAIARCEVLLFMYITYILVSISTPLAVTGPYGQLASM